MELSNSPQQTANVNVNCYQNGIPNGSSPPLGTLSFPSVSPPSPPMNTPNIANFPTNIGMNNNNNPNHMHLFNNKPSIPTMHQSSPMALNNNNMNMNMNINMNRNMNNNNIMNMNMNNMNNMNMNNMQNNMIPKPAFPAMINGMPMSMPTNINSIMPTMTTIPTKSRSPSPSQPQPQSRSPSPQSPAKQVQRSRQNMNMNMNMNIQQQMMMNPMNPMMMAPNGMNLKQQQMMQAQMMQRQMLQQQQQMQANMNNMTNMNNMNIFQIAPHNQSSNATLNAIGRNTQNKFAQRKNRSMEYLHRISALNKAKQMYEDELKKLKELGQLSKDYKEPSFPDLSGLQNTDSPNSVSHSPSIWSTSPIEISPATSSVSPPQQPIERGSIKAKQTKTPTKEKKDEEGTPTNENEPEQGPPTPADFVVKDINKAQTQSPSTKKIKVNVNGKKENNEIVTIVGGRVLFIPPVYPPTPTNNDGDDSKNNNNNPIPVQPSGPSLSSLKLSNFGNLKNLPNLSSLRSYSISNGFSLRQRTEERYDLRASRLKRSRTTFDPRGHSSKKLKSSRKPGLSGGLQERAKPKEAKTTLLTLNDISRKDVHVQRGVRKMLRNVSLMRARSQSCASLSSVKE